MARWLLYPVAVVGFFLACWLTACQSATKSQLDKANKGPGTPELTRDVRQNIDAAAVKNVAIGDDITATDRWFSQWFTTITPETKMPVGVVEAGGRIKNAGRLVTAQAVDLKNAGAAAVKAEKSATADAKGAANLAAENDKLRAADKTKSYLAWLAMALIAGGVALFAAYLFLPIVNSWKWVPGVGAMLIATGVVCYGLAQYLTLIFWLAVPALLIVGFVWWWSNRIVKKAVTPPIVFPADDGYRQGLEYLKNQSVNAYIITAPATPTSTVSG